MTGQILGGRYEILERVGGGGMALVYKAHDLLLNRHVAVKVLRQQYIHDEEFIYRFGREAQSAAALSHPNVVSIYDVGQDEDTHYIVMEYVEGMTLNDLIKQKAPLQVEEAVHIASQICDALDHAHANEIIHRDIKPHNILIGKNGRVKVTDFGIARAGTSSSITQTGSVVGSVHYFSPEHAKGIAAGAKSDLYSLGIVLYQMLTGKLPFLGDSPISVALKHLQEDVEEPRKVNPLIPQSVENIILKAMRKNPEQRYQSAAEMLRDLETCLLPERRNEPRLAEPEEDDGDDDEKTRIVPAIRSNHPGLEPEPDGKEKKRKRTGVWIWTLVFLVVVGALLAGIYYVKSQFEVKDVPVPDYINKHVDEAVAELESVNLVPNIVAYEHSDEVEENYVIDQNPKNTTIKEGSTVELTVSLGVELPKMKDYVGKKWADVAKEMEALGIDNSRIDVKEKHDEQAVDTILEQFPEPNEEFDPAKVEIKLTVSQGLEKFPMPDLTGKTVEEADATLLQKNLSRIKGKEGVIEKPSFSQPKGKIYDQWPYKPNQEVESGTNNIIYYVSSGPPEDAGQLLVTLPELKPKEEGKDSSFKIIITDAQYENYEYRTFEISKPDLLNVPVIVTKERNAVIQMFRDDAYYDSRTVTYNDYLEHKHGPRQNETESSSEPLGEDQQTKATPEPGGDPTPQPGGQ
ncbi:Stk1 family PASTA domain-containing Ser/Thr kinase [Paenibacillus sp. J2TS4]|uniref:Stk1 family PASTA domain-containing Ser/Thr kinase n=1 Tax=Paenibacillus sp. J2TS4 TaxID=2807194 RepID=UPI001B1C12CE|nr:Stk1 family PASTA domain-containing Ser/Thr kinase [Paenibacillus sp. J2TS4]GIP32956.1 serine/threonine-protein kinase PrkC [Paenibacillus sp. J2TS4]